MDYSDLLRLGGMTVHDYEEFGSYQGDWIAHVTFNGVTGYVIDGYGSCSHCDTLQGLDASHHGYIDDTYHYGLECYRNNKDVCEDCANAFMGYMEEAASYHDAIIPIGKALERAKRNEDWDMEAQAMVDFIIKCADGD